MWACVQMHTTGRDTKVPCQGGGTLVHSPEFRRVVRGAGAGSFSAFFSARFWELGAMRKLVRSFFGVLRKGALGDLGRATSKKRRSLATHDRERGPPSARPLRANDGDYVFVVGLVCFHVERACCLCWQWCYYANSIPRAREGAARAFGGCCRHGRDVWRRRWPRCAASCGYCCAP